MTPVMTLTAMLLLADVVAAADSRVSGDCLGLPAAQAIGLITSLTSADHEIDSALLATVQRQPLVFSLRQASPAGVRQAFAHALDAWWVDGDRRQIRYTRTTIEPVTTLTVRSYTFAVPVFPGVEAHVRHLMKPWAESPGAGLTYDADQHVWFATLDAQGHTRLVEVLTLLERPLPQCPPLPPDPDQPDPRHVAAAAVSAESWAAAVPLIANAWSCSVSLGPTMATIAEAVNLRPCALGELPAQCERSGVRAQMRHGVLCLDRATISERESSGRRRRLAILPIGHLLSGSADGDLLASNLRRRVAVSWWTQPGADLLFLPEPRALLVAADGEVLGQVLEALGRIDLLGLETGLTSLDAGTSAADNPRAR